ncbi:hypothetical protein C7M84_021538 [Penaeus vannamei]|uniref:Uncharacterized protein n=1 Tax=Penaeus vannamei TaxID=6689 RepID=A0A3R7LW39_PENVA|nr:hypothetical protein C7M84_021538 [Penaeus vannamei]
MALVICAPSHSRPGRSSEGRSGGTIPSRAINKYSCRLTFARGSRSRSRPLLSASALLSFSPRIICLLPSSSSSHSLRLFPPLLLPSNHLPSFLIHHFSLSLGLIPHLLLPSNHLPSSFVIFIFISLRLFPLLLLPSIHLPSFLIHLHFSLSLGLIPHLLLPSNHLPSSFVIFIFISLRLFPPLLLPSNHLPSFLIHHFSLSLGLISSFSRRIICPSSFVSSFLFVLFPPLLLPSIHLPFFLIHLHFSLSLGLIPHLLLPSNHLSSFCLHLHFFFSWFLSSSTSPVKSSSFLPSPFSFLFLLVLFLPSHFSRSFLPPSFPLCLGLIPPLPPPLASFTSSSPSSFTITFLFPFLLLPPPPCNFHIRRSTTIKTETHKCIRPIGISDAASRAHP